MKHTFALLVFIFPLLMGTACHPEGIDPVNEVAENIGKTGDSMKATIIIKVGDKKFVATLFDNASTNAFKEMLPLTMKMVELNGNEKYFQLPTSLPTNASNPGTIRTGDLMLWGSNTFVLFYETFSTSYSYTKLGKIDNPNGLASALGTGNVSVTVELP